MGCRECLDAIDALTLDSVVGLTAIWVVMIRDKKAGGRAALIAGFYLLLALIQLGPLVNERPGGSWFLFGLDTVSHDAPAQIWAWGEVQSSGRLPLWIPYLKAGLPTVGSFFWTPLAPSLWAHTVLPFPLAQRFQFLFAVWWAGLGGYWLARRLGVRRSVALLAGTGIGLSGHLVTLIYAGHLQKVLALAWLPWFAGAIILPLRAQGAALARSAAVGGAALGFAFLSGHPQIAYAMLMLLLLRLMAEAIAGRLRQDIWRGRLAAAGLLVLLGGGFGSAQMLPGLEMSALSNRAAGVSYEEAVETSYPPGEVLEFAFPRHLGDSSRSGYGVYFGGWGERLVSDYAGVVVVLLAFVAPFGARRFESVFWLLVLAVSLLVGFGDYTPVYKVLYKFSPGMSGFRSPGTFFAGAALALPVLGGFGLEALLSLVERNRKRALGLAGVVFCVLFLLALVGVWFAGAEMPPRELILWQSIRRSAVVAIAGVFAVVLVFSFKRPGCRHFAAIGVGLTVLSAMDLMLANSAFLRAEPWENYERYLAPTPVDVFASDLGAPRRVLEPGRELSLAPILHGRDALLGYHPISYDLFEQRLRETGLGTPEWRDQWGVEYILTGSVPDDLPDSFEPAARFPGGVILHDSETSPPVRAVEGELIEYEYRRTVNRALLRAEVWEGGTIEVAETIAPGWSWTIDGGGGEQGAAEVVLTRQIELKRESEVEWLYRPFSWRAGLFLTAIAGAIILALITGTRRGNTIADLKH